MQTDLKWQALGIVAGGGELPLTLAKLASGHKKPVFIAALQEHSDFSWNGYAVQHFRLDQIKAICAYFQAQGVDAITFAGNVSRPNIQTFNPGGFSTKEIEALARAAHRGDDALLRHIITLFEHEGFTVLGVADIAPELLAPLGLIGGDTIGDHDLQDCNRACEMARKIGALDIGQGVVVCDGVVLAVEAQEGTQAMLERCATLRNETIRRAGVFAKYAKPGQDRRIDLPVIGVRTIKAVADANLAGLAIEAGAVILLDREKIITTATQNGLFILGMKE